MDRSSLLGFVSRLQMGDSWIFEMRPPFVSNQVASVMGHKAKELALQSMSSLSVWDKPVLQCSPPRQGVVVPSQIGPNLILDQIMSVLLCHQCSDLSVLAAPSRPF